jgi:hypothetical protein
MLERVRSLAWLMTLAWAASGAEVVGNPPAEYAVVVSLATLAAPDWRAVADALVAKHRAQLVGYTSPVTSVAPQLAAWSPRYVCFVARPEEATREFVAETHRLIRRLDDDPWPDAFWGILTGYDATNALHIARQAAPLTIRKVASGTEVALEVCEEGRWYCELNPGRSVSKEITPRRGERTFSPINRNGVQRGGRPILEFLPHRLREVRLLAGAELNPLIADDFILVPNPGVWEPGKTYRVTFRAQPAGPPMPSAP